MKFNPINIGAVLLAVLCLQSRAATLYVDLNCANPVPPYSGWSTAATNIQDAIDAANAGDLVLVTNGIYATGGRVVFGSLTNRVVIDKAIMVQSVNGPNATSIVGNSTIGSNAIRCAFLVDGSWLSGFTLTNGGTLDTGDAYLEQCGGGVWTTNDSTATISNCMIIDNAARQFGGGVYYGNITHSSIIQNSAESGGGVAFSMATNCLVSSNAAVNYGGGAYSATMGNCKIFNNIADFGGGAQSSSCYGCLVVSNQARQMGGGMFLVQNVVNCTVVFNDSLQASGGINNSGGPSFRNNIIYYNTSTYGSSPNYGGLTSVENCCTTPLPVGSPATSGNNITNAPEFVASASGDFHLQSGSPCINSGTRPAAGSTDLDGNPRIVDGLTDIGAYEYQTPAFILPYYYAQKYGLPSDGSIDSDGDGLNNWQEAIAGTNPTNAASVLKIVSLTRNVSGNVVKWQSVPNAKYFLQRSTNLLASPAFISIYTNVPSLLPTLTYVDAMATNDGTCFYRVGIQ
jgi:hypothetical protein